MGLEVNWRSLYVVRYLDGAGLSRSEIGARCGTRGLDHNEHIRAVRSRGAEAGAKELRAYVERSVPHVPIVFQ
ncbi:MAG: hypothetical protein DMG76_35030 [Acidobacteria bacterium]|nr:MAG: hypothetical protein DMG76_35030 [Acidobacteriota bacterium]